MTIPRTMRAAVFEGTRGALTVRDVSVPELGPHDALIRIEASGICRSDWHVWNGDWGWMGVGLPSPAVLGHEMGGTVVAVGGGVTQVAAGARVTVPFNLACGGCPYCREGRQNLCDNARVPMLTPGSGGWAEYARVPDADLNCIPLPDGVDTLSAAALGCRYMTAWRAVKTRGAVRGGEAVAVFGCGGVGLAAVEIAAALGARVAAVDIDDAKLARARELGAGAVVNGAGKAPDAVAKEVRRALGSGADLSIDALGASATCVGALLSLRKGGRLAQVGLTSREDKGSITLPIDALVGREWSVVGSYGNPHSDYAPLLAMVAAARLRPKALVGREVALGDIETVLTGMDRFETMGFTIVTRFDA